MDTANLIEEAERWAKNVSESPGNGTAGEDLYGAKLLCDLAAALKASEERARKAEELAAANLAANKRIVKLEQELSEEQQLTEDASRLVVGCLDALGANIAKMAAEPYDAEKLNALRRGIPDRIRALRLELARLTTPRPIAEAPTDKPVLGIWIDHRGNKCFEVLRWGGRWKGALGTPLYREAEYLPLPEVKP